MRVVFFAVGHSHSYVFGADRVSLEGKNRLSSCIQSEQILRNTAERSVCISFSTPLFAMGVTAWPFPSFVTPLSTFSQVHLRKPCDTSRWVGYLLISCEPTLPLHDWAPITRRAWSCCSSQVHLSLFTGSSQKESAYLCGESINFL
jgi:hypothetical protein